MSAIVHVDLGATFRGGQRQVLLLARAQASRGDEVTVLAASPVLRRHLEQAGVSSLPLGVSGLGGLSPWRVRSLCRAARVLHAHDARAHGLLRGLAPRSAPLVVHRRIDDAPSARVSTRWKYSRGLILCVSAAVREVMAGFGVPEQRLRVVHSAVPEVAAPRRAPRAGPLRLLSLGALVEHKGHQDLLTALRRTSAPMRLDVIGAGPLRSRLEREAQGLPVRFLGDPEGTAPRWGEYDLLVHPSRTEGLGTAVLDAQAAGLPVLATTAGGLGEATAPTSWQVPPRSPDALAAGLDRIAGVEHDELASRGDQARAWVRARFSVSRMLAGVDAAYGEVDSAS